MPVPEKSFDIRKARKNSLRRRAIFIRLGIEELEKRISATGLSQPFEALELMQPASRRVQAEDRSSDHSAKNRKSSPAPRIEDRPISSSSVPQQHRLLKGEQQSTEKASRISRIGEIATTLWKELGTGLFLSAISALDSEELIANSFKRAFVEGRASEVAAPSIDILGTGWKPSGEGIESELGEGESGAVFNFPLSQAVGSTYLVPPVGIGSAVPQQALTLGAGFNLATEMATPIGVNAVAAAGGSLPSGTYFFSIVASDGIGTTVGSQEVSATVSNNGRVQLSWSPVVGAASYRVYKGTAAGAEDRYQVTKNNSYSYVGDKGAMIGSIPTVTSAFVNKVSAAGNSWLNAGNLGLGTATPAARLHLSGAFPNSMVSKIETDDPASGDWNFTQRDFPNPASARSNQTLLWGYNVNAGGGPEKTGEPSLNYALESFWVPAPGKEYVEAHLEYFGNNGKQLRPITMAIDRNTDFIDMAIHADRLNFFNGAGTNQWMVFEPNTISIVGTPLLQTKNNTPWLRQLDTNGSGVPLVYLDNSDRVTFAPYGNTSTLAGRVGVGVFTPTSTFQVGGSQAVQRTAIASDYTLTDRDYYVGVVNTSAARTVTLPSAVGIAGRVYVIKDESGGANTNNIIVRSPAGQTIDGMNTRAINSAFGAVTVVSSGSQWFVSGSYASQAAASSASSAKIKVEGEGEGATVWDAPVGIGSVTPQEALTLGPGLNLATELTVPANVTATPSTGGSLAAGTYYFQVVATDGIGTTTGSTEVSAIVGANGRAQISWSLVPGAASYRIYKGTSAGAEDRYQVTTATTYGYTTDTGAQLAPVPTVNTAFVNRLSAVGNSWIDGGNLGIGTTSPIAKLHLAGPYPNDFVEKISTGDPASGDWNVTQKAFPNPGSSRSNQTLLWGYNVNAGGGPEKAGEPSLNFAIAGHWSPSPGKEYVESHLQYYSARGRQLRPLSLAIDRNTHFIDMGFHTDKLSFFNGAGTNQWMVFERNAISIVNTPLVQTRNNTPWLRQANTAGSQIPLLFLDNNDRVAIAPYGNTTTFGGKVGVGMFSPTSTFQVGGSQAGQRTAVASDYTLTDKDYYVAVTNTAAPRTLTLPTAAGIAGRIYVIKDESGGAATKNITIAAQPGQLIDGANSQKIISNQGNVTLISSGSHWFVLGAAGQLVTPTSSASATAALVATTSQNSTTPFTSFAASGITGQSQPELGVSLTSAIAQEGESVFTPPVGIGTATPQEALTIAAGENVVTELAVPANVTAAPASGGSLSAGIYYFTVVASDGIGTTAGSQEVSAVVAAGGRVNLSWNAVPGAAMYHVYKGTSPKAEDRYQTSATHSYSYLSDAGAVLGSVPDVTTAYVNKISSTGNSWFNGGNLGVGTAKPEAKLHLAGPYPNGIVEKISTGDPASGDWNITQRSWPNPASTRNNQTLLWGYNVNAGGGPEKAGEPSLNYALESYWVPQAGHELVEAHIEYFGSNGRQLRPLTMAINRNTNFVDTGLHTDKLNFFDGAGVNRSLVFQPSGISVVGVPLIQTRNNAPWIRQLDSAGSQIPLLFLDNGNRVAIAPYGNTSTFGGRVGVGMFSPTSTFQVGGSKAVQRTAVIADYTLTDRDYYIGVANTAAPRTLTLPSAVGVVGRTYVIKDESGGAGNKNITIKGPSGQTIDNNSNKVLNTNYGTVTLISNGSQWFSI